MAYFVMILSDMLLIAFGNFLAGDAHSPTGFWGYFLCTSLGVAAVVAIDAVLALFVRSLPKRWFVPEKQLCVVKERERRFYRRLGIHSWKKYVPDLGCFTGFQKAHLQDPSSSAYVGRFLLESNYGVVGHLAGAFLGFLILLLPFLPTFSVALPIALVNFVLNLLPTMILRYNIPSLLRLYRRNLLAEQRKTEEQTEKHY